MRITIKKWGNSAGVVIPGVVMQALNMQVGQSMDAQVVDSQLVLTPVGKGYSLEALLAQCDMTAPEIGEEELWDKSGPTGDEVW